MSDLNKQGQHLNIVYAHRTQGRGVEGVHIKGIANAFNKLGHHVDFITVPGVSMDNAEAASDNRQIGKKSIWSSISLYAPQIFFEFMELMYNFVLYQNLLKISKRRHIDFIYERYALNTFATTLFGKNNNIPVILEINDATGIQRVRHLKAEMITKKIESWVFKNSDGLVTISSEFERILLERGFERNKVSFVPNAVDPLVFDPNLYKNHVRTELKLEDKIVIGFVGSFARWHGVEVLLNVMNALKERVPEAHYLLVGSGVCLDDVKRKVGEMGLDSCTTFTGNVSPEKVPFYLKAMNIGVIPDSNNYGSPMKLFEYMAMKVIPVAPKLPPIEDVINDGVTGYIFEKRNESELLEQLTRACNNCKADNNIGENSRKEVLRKHLWQHNANHVLNVFNNSRI